LWQLKEKREIVASYKDWEVALPIHHEYAEDGAIEKKSSKGKGKK
jgi:hypothetical protein